MAPTKVLLVDDSPIALEILQRLFTSSPEVVVVGTARSGQEALDLIPQTNPEVVCTDLHMEPMNGLELTQQIMANYPRPILVISNSVKQDDTKNVFNLLQAGAVDIFPKPVGGDFNDYATVKQKLFTKIKVLSSVTVKSKPLNDEKLIKPTPVVNNTNLSIQNNSHIKIIAIGGSTGGPQAIHKIISSLPSNLPVPIVCTQHITEGFLNGLISWLDNDSPLHVKIAQVGESPVPGVVYFAPEKSHLELDLSGKFMYSDYGIINGHIPSIDITFKSLARSYGSGVAGILLTGMGNDGAVGLKTIANQGGTTIVQDEKTCVIFAMPKAAIDLDAVQQVLSIHEIAPFLVNAIMS